MSQPDYICNVLTRMSSCRVFLSFFYCYFISLYLLSLYFFIFVIKLVIFIKFNQFNHLNLDFFFYKTLSSF